MQPMAAAALPSMRIMPGRLVHPLDEERVLLGEVRFGVVGAGLERRHVQLDAFAFLPELLA